MADDDLHRVSSTFDPSPRCSRFARQRSLSSSYIPWRVLFDTERENPFRSKSSLGWFPLGSMFNHSCLPNCLWYLLGDCLFIYVCSSTIRAGDELTLSYCPLWIGSLQERATLLRPFGIGSCRCSLCSYDRSNMPQYEIELKKFVNLRALAREATLSPSKRFVYVKQLKQIFESLSKRFKQRPMGFIREFLDLESIDELLPHTCEFQEYLLERQLSFLVRLSRVCRFNSKDLPKLGNPLVLFGRQMQVTARTTDRHSELILCDL